MATSDKDTVSLEVRQSEGDALNLLILAQGGPSKVAAAADIAPAYLTQLKQGIRPLNLKTAVALAKALGKSIDDFSPRLARTVSEALPHLRPADQGGGAVVVMEPRNDYQLTPKVDWPFATVTPRQWALISAAGRQQLESIARGMAIEADSVKRAS